MPQFLSTRDADFETRFAALLSQKREDSPDVDAASPRSSPMSGNGGTRR